MTMPARTTRPPATAATMIHVVEEIESMREPDFAAAVRLRSGAAGSVGAGVKGSNEGTGVLYCAATVALPW